MVSLDIPIPPQLERAVGYGGEARFIALYWGAGDEAYYNDGRISATGHPHAYLCYVRHPAVALELAGVNLGSTDDEADSWLVIDRRDRKAFVAPVAEARRFLREQWHESPAVPAVLSQEEFAALFDNLRRDFESRPMPTPAEVMAAMQEQRRVETDMKAWLDATPQAQKARRAMRRLTDDEQSTG